MHPPSPRSLILDLLSTLPPEATMPVGLLVDAGALFGIPNGTLRVALTRLLGSQHVARDQRGAYRLSTTAIAEAIGRWRTQPADADWDGAWWGVLCDRRPRHRAGRRHDQALKLHGFASLRNGLFLRPANLSGGIQRLRSGLRGVGLVASALVVRIDSLDEGAETEARTLWATEALAEAYARSLDELATSTAHLDDLAPEAAMRESFLIGGRILQQLVLDPKLPAEIGDPAGRVALTQAMRDYDQRGRAAWAPLLERYGVPDQQAPTDAGYDRVVAA